MIEGGSQENECRSNVIETIKDEKKPTFNDLIYAGGKSAIVDLTSPRIEPNVKRSKSLLDSYASQKVAEVKPGDFLSRLEGSQSRAIDFNDTSSSYKAPSGQEGTTQSQPRKRKYKLVDNEPPKPVAEVKPTIPGGSQGGNSSQEVLPEDRGQLIKVVKEKLLKEDYKALLVALKSYQTTSCLQVLFDEISVVFMKPEHHFMLRGMRRFVKNTQYKEFDDLLVKHNIL